MIPDIWVKALPWLIAAVLAFALAGMTHLYLAERDEFTAFQAQVKQLGEQAEAEKVRIEQDYSENLKKVQANYEQRTVEVRSSAVRTYAGRMRNTSSRSSAVPAIANGIKVDDGASKECVPDRTFIEDASEDALKVEAWREWATLNGVIAQ